MTLFYHEIMHLVVSLLAGFIIYSLYHKKEAYLWAIISGFFIDIDHWFDNWIAYGINFDLARFFFGGYFEANGKIIIPLHGWEYVIALLFLGHSFKKYQAIFFALALSLFLHLFIDSISYNCFADYSIIHRVLNGFRI